MSKTNNQENSSTRSSFSLLKQIQDSRIPSNSADPCQICGDVGDKNLIMVCFQCRESREHTYCTEVLLPSVPEIWICEECRSSSRILLTSTLRDDRKVALATNDVTNCTLGSENSNTSDEIACNHVEEAPLRAPVSESCNGSVANGGSEHLPPLILQAHTNPEGEEGCLKLRKISRRKRQRSPVCSFFPIKKKQEPLQFTDRREVLHQDPSS